MGKRDRKWTVTIHRYTFECMAKEIGRYACVNKIQFSCGWCTGAPTILPAIPLLTHKYTLYVFHWLPKI